MDESKQHGNGATGHETRDADIRSVTKIGAGIILGVVISMALMWFLFDRLAIRESELSPHPERMAAANPQKQPPEPRLQPAPVIDYQKFQETEDMLLNDYGWIDPEKGIVRIPVERALELVAKEGLPSRKEAASQ